MRTIQTIQNQYDNIMKPLVWSDKVAKNFLNCIKNPIVIEKKDMIPQWKICTVNDNKRRTESIGSTDVLILDYDDPNYSIKEFEDNFREYFYVLHTSHSYDGSNQKFRVFLFLDKEYDINRMFYKCFNQAFSPYHYLVNYFLHADKASFVKCQFFKVPAVKYKGAPYYYSCHNGKLFDPVNAIGFEFRMAYEYCVEKQEEHLKQLEKRAKWYRKMNGSIDLTNAKQYINEKIETCEEGGRHMQILGLACWFKKIGGTFKEFEEIIPSWADKGFHRQMEHIRHEWDKFR